MLEVLDRRLLTRVREVLDERPVTEAELRALGEELDGRARVLRAQIEGSERRLERLAGDPACPLAELAQELRRVEALRPALAEASSLLAGLEVRGRRLRTEWLLRQAAAPAPSR